MKEISISQLQTGLRGVTDQRQAWKISHPLINLLVIGFATILSGGESFEDMVRFGECKCEFFSRHLDLRAGIPSHDTFARVFASLRPEELLNLLQAGLECAGQHVCLDGKTLRGSRRGATRGLHLLNVFVREQGLTLGQWLVDGKSNEISALPTVIRSLELSGSVVTVDAMGCQTSIARELSEADADYVLVLKDHHPLVLAEMSAFLTDADRRGELTVWEEHDKGHGRLERRRYCQSDQLAWFANRAQWERLTSVLLVERTRTVHGATTTERHYYLSSLPVDPRRLAGYIRGHWSIENNLHWSLDVTFGEDRCLVANPITAQNLALLRKLALNTVKLDTSCKDALKGKRLRAGWDEAYLAKLLGFHA